MSELSSKLGSPAIWSGVRFVALNMPKLDPIRKKDTAICDRSIMKQWLYGSCEEKPQDDGKLGVVLVEIDCC